MTGAVSTKQLSEALGVTLRQLQWWDEQGVVGHIRLDSRQRYWNRDAILSASIAAELRKHGVSLHRARKAIAYAKLQLRRYPSRPRRFYIAVDANGSTRVTLTGDVILELILTMRQPVTVCQVWEALTDRPV